MNLNIWTFLFELINFVVLAYILHRLLYRPLRMAVDERRQASARMEAAAHAAQRESDVLRNQVQAQLADIEVQRQVAIREAREQATAERKKLLHETDDLVRRRHEEERQVLTRERTEAYQGLRKEIIEQAVGLAEKFLAQSADRTLNGQMAQRLVETLQSLPANEQEELRAHWQPKDGAVLETADDLDAAAQENITVALTDLLGPDVPLTVRTSRPLLGGVRLRLGGQVWDASLAGSLEQARFFVPEASINA